MLFTDSCLGVFAQRGENEHGSVPVSCLDACLGVFRQHGQWDRVQVPLIRCTPVVAV